MGILNLFRKSPIKITSKSKTNTKNELAELKSKRINYVYEDFNKFLSLIKSDIQSSKKLVPVNYYAIKNKFIEGQFFYNSDYSECYVKYTAFENDTATKKSDVFNIDSNLLSYLFSKVGIIIANTAN
ncbi:MAG: hypothetical protein GX896_03615 [Clostridiales bacterium]|nr:hypothetical protein [Clostridiales bacterium]